MSEKLGSVVSAYDCPCHKANCRRTGPEDPHLGSVLMLRERGGERGVVLVVKTRAVENWFLVVLRKKELVGRLSKMRMHYAYRCGS